MNRLCDISIAAIVFAALSIPASAQPGDAARGERMFRACVACHSLEANRNMTGPSLAELWNRRRGAWRASRAIRLPSNHRASSGTTPP